MTELLQIAGLATVLFGTLFFFVNELMKKDNRIAELEHSLIQAYTEIELRNLGVMK